MRTETIQKPVRGYKRLEVVVKAGGYRASYKISYSGRKLQISELRSYSVFQFILFSSFYTKGIQICPQLYQLFNR